MATRDLPGVPPVPPSDMDPAFRALVEKRKVAIEKSLKAVHDELALFRDGASAFLVDRRNYLLGRERKFLADLVEIDRVLKGEK